MLTPSKCLAVYRKLIAVNTNPHPLSHTQSNTSSASTSTAKASASNSTPGSSAAARDGAGYDDANATILTTGTGRETLWRAEGTAPAAAAKGSVYSMKKVPKQSSKARGKQAAKAEPKLPNGNASADHGENGRDDDHHDRDVTAATYRTAQEHDEPEEDDTDEQEDEDGQSTTDGPDSSLDEERSESRSRLGQQHGRFKKPRPAQDIFPADLSTIGKVSYRLSQPYLRSIFADRLSNCLVQMKTQERLQKALALPDDEFARQLTQL